MQEENIISRIIRKLSKYPNIRCQQTNNQEITIFADTANGFDIVVTTSEQENTLYLDNFHTHFDNTEHETTRLRRLFFQALAGDTRIKAFYKQGDLTAYKHILQHKNQQEQWVNEEVMGQLFFKFWRKTTIKYLQNNYPIDDSDKN